MKHLSLQNGVLDTVLLSVFYLLFIKHLQKGNIRCTENVGAQKIKKKKLYDFVCLPKQ